MSESCNSRHFSCLMKSCFPNPHDSQIITPAAANKTTAATTTRLVKTTISSLPDDLLLEILSRVPLPSLPSLSLVSRRWLHLLDSSAFLHLRRSHHLLHRTLFALSLSDHAIHAAALRLETDASWKTSLFPHNDAGVGAFSHARLVAIGRRIYILGRNSTAEYDSWTGSLRFKAAMLFPRKKFAAAAVEGRIYVAGGAARASALEEFDPERNEWRVVCDAPRRRYGCVGVGIEGLFFVIGGLKIGACVPSEAQMYASSLDVYDVEGGCWLKSRSVPGGGCVVAACGAIGSVYVFASHAVELSFWRYNARRRSDGGGEWSRMKNPPLPTQMRLDSTVRFGCVGVEEKVVLIQVGGSIDDLLRRSGRTVRGCKEGLVLVFDCVRQEWSRGADLPEVIQRAACVCVEC